MQPHAAELRHLDRQVILARPIFLVMALVELLVVTPGRWTWPLTVFFALYGLLAAGRMVQELVAARGRVALPLWVDVGALAIFLLITPSLVAFLFLLLYVAFAAGTRWGVRPAVPLMGAATLALLVRAAVDGPMPLRAIFSWIAFAAGTFAGGTGLAYLGSRQRRQAAEHEFLTRTASALRVDLGLAECIRRLLSELADGFRCRQALLAFHDQELALIFLWRVRAGEDGRIAPEHLPAARRDSFFLDLPDASICWNGLDQAREGFAWNRQTGERIAEVPALPGIAREELGARSLLSATFDFEGQPSARLLLLNGARKFKVDDLRWLERIARHMSPALENVFRLRSLRARTVESERSRISHDLHDGVLQTMLGLDIQLEVLRRKMSEAAQPAAAEVAGIQQALRRESQELRRMVNDLRPLHVASADLIDMMRSYGERFRSEAGIPLELLTEAIGAAVSDRICRELFQIYREALHNIKKHAKATHVVIKLWQDEAKVCLMVDDNGKGFSFAGQFSSDELDRLRLGPISIKERTRSVGGVLTVESNPGHGARLIVAVPLS